VLLSSLLITLAVVVVATPIRTYLFGGATGSGADFFVAYMNVLGTKLIESVAITVFGTNLVDKVICALVAWFVVRGLPDRIRGQFPDAAPVR
jgi:energy-coupling factor transport system substrate-specific component